MATDYSQYNKYGRIPRDPVKVRWTRLGLALLFLILLLLAYSKVEHDQLQDQPTAEERRAKIQKEKDEAAAWSLFHLQPSTIKGGK